MKTPNMAHRTSNCKIRPRDISVWNQFFCFHRNPSLLSSRREMSFNSKVGLWVRFQLRFAKLLPIKSCSWVESLMFMTVFKHKSLRFESWKVIHFLKVWSPNSMIMFEMTTCNYCLKQEVLYCWIMWYK